MGLRGPGDVLVGLTTSGSSPNVLAAVRMAATMGVRTIGMTGAGGGKLLAEVEICIRVPHHRTNRIQEMHIAVGHALCGQIERALC